jgi:hypothetical protein
VAPPATKVLCGASPLTHDSALEASPHQALNPLGDAAPTLRSDECLPPRLHRCAAHTERSELRRHAAELLLLAQRQLTSRVRAPPRETLTNHPLPVVRGRDEIISARQHVVVVATDVDGNCSRIELEVRNGHRWLAPSCLRDRSHRNVGHTTNRLHRVTSKRIHKSFATLREKHRVCFAAG